MVTAARLKPDKITEYVTLHRNAWPQVKEELKLHHHTNHSVYRKDDILFQYLEYTGENLEQDMAEMRANPVMESWWERCRQCVDVWCDDSDTKWVTLEEVFYNQ